MYRSVLFLLIVFLLNGFFLFAQKPGMNSDNMPKNGVVSGNVIDLADDQPIEYTNVSVYRMRDSSLVTGTITDVYGDFVVGDLTYGKYWLDADFMGYKKSRIKDIIIRPQQSEINIGTIKLEPAAEQLEAVEVTADRHTMEYKLDKKVINVSQDVISASQTAVDILENSPSIQTDIEGNVSLRGSSNFTVLIDGKPSALGGNDALQSLPASSIEKIEIITNPSVKYDPEGIGGIINIITKKSKKGGLSGIVNLKAGTEPSYGGDALINYRKKKYNLFANVVYGKGTRPGKMKMERAMYSSDSLIDTKNNDFDANMGRYSETTRLKAGIDLYPSKRHTISWFAAYTERGFGRNSDAEGIKYTMPATVDSFYLNESGVNLRKKALSSNLNHQFKSKNKKHSLNSYINVSFEDGYDVNEVNKRYTIPAGDTINTKSVENEDEFEFEYKSEYVFIVNEKSKLEAGLEIEIEQETTEYRFNNRENNITGWQQVDSLNTDLFYKRNIYAGYMMYANSLWTIDYQLGFRMEMTDREINQQNIDSVNTLYRPDYFPSLHLSKKLPAEQEIMVSYSRRIHRPRGYQLTPYRYYFDDETMRAGNPELQPEYINSYELNYQKRYKGSFFSVETYFRQTKNLMQRVRSIENEDIMVHTMENVGKDQSIGLELMVNSSPFQWWNIILTGNVYNYRLDGNIDNVSSVDVTNTWNTRLNSTFKLKWGTRLQVMGMYIGPSITAQGERSDFYFVNLGVRQDLLKKRLSASVSVRDIFDTMKHAFKSNNEDFANYHEFDMLSPQLNFTLTYRINNYKPDKSAGQMNESSFSGGEAGM